MDIIPGEKLLIKMWETLADKGIGSLLKPWQIRREGKATAEVQAEAIVLLAQAEKTAEEIKNGKLTYVDSQLKALPNVNSTGERVEPYIELGTLPQLIIKNNVEDSIRKEINVSKAILIAHETLANDPSDPPEESINDDWLYRWRDYAGEVSTDELQALWGNLLAGELKNPSSFSLRTLEFLRNLSQEEAIKIEHLNSFVIDSFVCLEEKHTLEEAGLNFAALLELQELGVLSGVEGSNLTLKKTSLFNHKFEDVLTTSNKVLTISSPNPISSYILTVCKLTSLGLQLKRLGLFPVNEKYLRAVGLLIKRQGFSVKLANVVLSENYMAFDNPENL